MDEPQTWSQRISAGSPAKVCPGNNLAIHIRSCTATNTIATPATVRCAVGGRSPLSLARVTAANPYCSLRAQLNTETVLSVEGKGEVLVWGVTLPAKKRRRVGDAECVKAAEVAADTKVATAKTQSKTDASKANSVDVVAKKAFAPAAQKEAAPVADKIAAQKADDGGKGQAATGTKRDVSGEPTKVAAATPKNEATKMSKSQKKREAFKAKKQMEADNSQVKPELKESKSQAKPESKGNTAEPNAETESKTSGNDAKTKPLAEVSVKPLARRQLPSGLQYEVLRTGGKGPIASFGKSVQVKYEGFLTTGKRFDKGTIMFRLGVGEVIRGWDEGLKDMMPGERRRLLVPHHLAYGVEGAPPTIPPRSNLVFDVTFNGVK